MDVVAELGNEIEASAHIPTGYAETKALSSDSASEVPVLLHEGDQSTRQTQRHTDGEKKLPEDGKMVRF